ncbi:MAG: arylsulfatase [Gemmataceae bacterium]|nr:arylsulfatase [Gemmataceae bacterium]
MLGAGAGIAHFHGSPGQQAWAQAAAAQGGKEVDRSKGSVLPVPEPTYRPITAIDARKAKAPPRFQVKPPRGAPNIVIVLIDDMGFGHPSAFGGPIRMPNADKLAKSGIKYNHFHNTSLCSPTRMALLTGRNHHSCNTGAVMELATAFPGNTGIRPQNVATLAEMLRLWGYITGAFGKYHETPTWEVSPSGPFDRWPTRSGFDKFYGFIGGETNQWAPLIYDGVTRVETPNDPKYHFTTDMTTRAIEWTRSHRSLTPERPFFMYFAPGATHAPHHVPSEWIARYKGKFDGGWDKLREDTLKRQIKLGVVPKGTRLAPMPPGVRPWDKLSADEKKLFARQMEVFAAFGEHTDHEVGRLIAALEEMEVMENTLFFYILGDNGSSAEGGLIGTLNETLGLNGLVQFETVARQLARLAELGGPTTYNHFAVGWAVAGNTPFQWVKQMASHFGGTRTGMIVHWPRGIKAKNEVRTQFHHVIDIAPTVLEAIGVPQPDVVEGFKQRPIEGVSINYSFADARAKDRRTTQYFEMFGNRGIYHEGWTACAQHSIPWDMTQKLPKFAEDRWELYHVAKDFSQADDLAARHPQKLKELQALFLVEAKKYNVLPLDDRRVERFNPVLAGRPDLMFGRKKLTVFEGMTGMMENAFLNVKNASHTITAQVEVPADARGVLLAQGGRFAGWSLYLKDGRLSYAYNWFGIDRTTITSRGAVPAGKATIRFAFAADSAKPGTGGKVTLHVNDQKVAEGRLERTVPFMYSAEDGADVGMDDGTPVTEAYRPGPPSRFTGRIRRIDIELK